MQNPASYSRKVVSLLALSCVLAFSPFVNGQNTQNAAQSPCPTTTSTRSAGQISVLEAEKQNLKNAGKQLGALFNKKRAATAATSASPCPSPSAEASAAAPSPAPAASSAPASAAAPAQASQANANVPIPPTAPFSSSLIPPSPAGGLDPSKLPDLVGIHIGEPTDQVLAEVKKLYPLVRNGRGTVVSGDLGIGAIKYANTNDPRYTSSMLDTNEIITACTPPNCKPRDEMRAIFSGPPEKMAVQLQRTLSWNSGGQPTVDTLKTALIQKYGQHFVESPPLTLTWLFDEAGKPMPPLSKAVAYAGCQGILSQQGYPAGNPQVLQSYLGISTPTVTQQNIDRIVKQRCGVQVWVQAQINGLQDGTATQLTVMIREIAADLRDAFAAENYIRQATNAQSNQQLKNAQQQAAPTF